MIVSLLIPAIIIKDPRFSWTERLVYARVHQPYQEEGGCTVTDIALDLEISERTGRKCLKKLIRLGLVKSTGLWPKIYQIT